MGTLISIYVNTRLSQLTIIPDYSPQTRKHQLDSSRTPGQCYSPLRRALAHIETSDKFKRSVTEVRYVNYTDYGTEVAISWPCSTGSTMYARKTLVR